MRRWIPAPLLASLLLLPNPGFATKPAPPPPRPTIVSMMEGYAFASDGTVYELATTATTAICTPALTSAVLYGRFFTAPQASPIASVIGLSYGFQATLANGDMWFLNRANTSPCYLTGLYMGNIFTVAGTPLGATPPVNPAPVRSAPEDGASAAHGPRSVPPVPGTVE